MDAKRLQPGDRFGRWTIVGSATPARRAGDNYLRPRCRVRCFCGTEQVAWEIDIKRGRSTGCRSFRCRGEWLGLQSTLHVLDEGIGISAELYDAVEGRVEEVAEAVRRFVQERGRE